MSGPSRRHLALGSLLVALCMAPTPGDVGGCGAPAIELGARGFFKAKREVDCRRCEECDVFTRLCAAASAHSRYLQMNGEFGHEESPGKAGYVGADLMMRLTAFGYGGGAYEDINLGRPTLGSAVRSLFDAPYHRIPFLQPGSPDFGIGTSGRITTLDFGRTALSETAVSPGDGQRGVPSAWNSIETPDPLRLHEVKRPVGYVIVFVYYTPDNERIRVTSAFLTDSRGREIPFFLNAPTNDNHLTNAVFLIPRQPLKPANTYTVSVDAYAASGKNISREWNFTTAAPVKRKSK